MILKLATIYLLVGGTHVLGSPFLITDKYVDDFKKGLADFAKSTKEYQFHEESYDHTLYNETESEKHAEEYDFVIIGAGGSGAVVANRLSEVPEWKVLVLEAGAPENDYTLVPRLSGMFRKSDYDWGFTTTPQKNWCKGMIDNKCPLASGKALGGSTAINGMIYTRGNSKDYDKWADLKNDGWCYDDVLPYFKKQEDAHIKNPDNKYHNRGGPVHLENPQYMTEVVEAALEAGREEGLETVDYNGKEQIGMGVVQINTKSGTRQSTAQAYLEPAKKRTNLKIQPKSHVVEIIISPHTKEAVGVKYLHDGKLLIAKATKEVILSAGAINTPKLLKLSGIGPKAELAHHGIEAIHDLEGVGENLKDHVGYFGLDFIYNETDHDKYKGDQVFDYLKNGKGPLTSIGCEVLAFIKTEVSKEPIEHYPDVELFFLKHELSGEPGSNVFGFKPEVYESMWKPVHGKQAITIGVVLTHPKSSGTVKLKDKDPLHLPLIDPNQLSDPDDHDLNTIVAGIKRAIKISETKALQKLGLKINDHPLAGCEGYKFGTDDYWKCAVKHLSISFRHFTGTARMGPDSDKQAVVDNKLKVYGVHKLRVVDTSVVPITITGHTMAVAIMIGEKASDLIKESWK